MIKIYSLVPVAIGLIAIVLTDSRSKRHIGSVDVPHVEPPVIVARIMVVLSSAALILLALLLGFVHLK